MFIKIAKELGRFSSAVLTGLDAEGYPFSVRCQPQPDAGAQVFRLRFAPGIPLQPGRASLLCHSHDDLIWNQRSFLVRGVLERGTDYWTLRPEQFLPMLGLGGVMSLIKFVVGARRETKRYLAKRGLPRPTIPWAEIMAIRERAKAERRK